MRRVDRNIGSFLYIVIYCEEVISVEEMWKTVRRNHIYQVSNLGNVRSIDREVTDRLGRTRKYKGTMLKPSKDEYGYLLVGLSDYGHTNKVFIHRLVAEEFIANPENKPTINHIDGNKENNHVDNLEWATYRENRDHAVNARLLDVDKVRKRCMSFSKPVRCADTGQTFQSISDAARHYNVDTGTIKYWIHTSHRHPHLEFVQNR